MSTTIWERARELYTQHAPDRTLEVDVLHFVEHGYVFSSPDYIIMGKRSGDAWHIHLAVGHGCLRTFLGLMPYPLTYIGWMRRGGKVRWYLTENLIRRIKYEKAP